MNHLIFWKDCKLFYGSNSKTIKKHSHPIIQFVLAVNGTFLFKNKTGKWVEKKGLLFSPNYTHECDAKNIPIISIEIDPQSDLGEWILSTKLNNQSLLDYPVENSNPLNIEKVNKCIVNENWEALRLIIESTFHFQPKNYPIQLDQRIQDVLDFITNHINKDITTKKLMGISHLSESRLIHLFKEEMGLPIRNYILWCRLQIVFKSIMEGKSLTLSSYEAGFSDQAHMTRTFNKMVGVSPSIIKKNSKFVQVSFPI